MRTTIELSDRTYTRLRAAAAERGIRGFSPIVEEAVVQLLEIGVEREPASARGLASIAGALAEWDELDEVVSEIYANRRTSTDRPPPDLD